MTAGRRAFLIASAAALPGCASLGPPPLPEPSRKADLGILSGLLSLERQAIAAYRALEAALPEDARARASAFRGEHQRHAELLVAHLQRLGGALPPEAGPSSLTAPTAEAALRRLAAEERGLAAAYLGAVPALAERDLSRAAASVLAVETMHLSHWRWSLGEPPTEGPVFPAN